MSEAILSTVAPYIMQLIALIVTGIVAWVAAEAKKRFGVEIEAKHREALHSALMTGAQLALARLGPMASQEALSQITLDYAKRSAPDAIDSFSLSEEFLREMAGAKLFSSARAPL
ncbi:hypothetical protein [Thioclava sp. GXIMD2076]|uniref:hypothetical protein n=1 Tax=Thioclava sp. GXIMD2076 TaxID=3131931 RepID=UPI0030CE6028